MFVRRIGSTAKIGFGLTDNGLKGSGVGEGVNRVPQCELEVFRDSKKNLTGARTVSLELTIEEEKVETSKWCEEMDRYYNSQFKDDPNRE